VEILNLGSAAEENTPAPKARKKLRVILGIGALAAVTGIGSTLAANISLNGGGNVEFGQGVATTAACDEDITLTPVSEFSNTSYGYDEATFTMTAIQISGIDLTPEGWDVSTGAWLSEFNPETKQWADGSQEHSGQYYNSDTGVWTNTCANKSLMLRAYTDNPEYANRTDDWDIASPLILNGLNSVRPNNSFNDPSGFNAGVGFRYETFSIGATDWDYQSWLIADDSGNYSGGSNTSPLNLNVATDGQDYDGDRYNSTVIIYLGQDSIYPPADSRWIDKLTIESAATTPNGWYEDNQG